MSMSDVRRLKREVAGSEGIASPVRAMFSRQIPDGDTLLAGEMAGVDDGLVIQELSRPEELEKLQRELAKQVSKLAELGELKWLERLEAIETEELQEMKERLRLKARKAAEELREKANAEELKKQEEEKIKALEWLGKKLEEIGKLQSAEEIQKLRELGGDLGLLEVKELEKLKKKLVEKLKEKGKLQSAELETLEELGKLEKKKLEEVKETKKEVETKVGKLGGAFEKIEEIKPAELEKTWLFKKLGKLEEVKKLGGTVEELAAIRELKAVRSKEKLRELRLGALSLEEQLRTLAEIKEVKALAEKQKAGGLEIQEGLQLTERMGKLNGRLVRLAAQKLEEIQELGARNEKAIRKETNPQSIKRVASRLEEISVLRELGKLDELIPEEQLRTLAEVKGTIAQLEAQKLEEVKETKEKLVKKLEEIGVFSAGELEKKLEVLKKKVKGLTEQNLAELDKHWLLKRLGKDELKNKLEELAKIKALEELTEIAEKRGVATTLKAALANAMETTKNRGWTDYLNSLDSSKRVNAVRELIAAEKIRAWAGDINNLDVDERAMVAGAFARAVEGAEVIEVRAIGSTSVMLNACYDLLTDGIGVVPNSAYPTLSSPAHPQLPAYVPSTHTSVSNPVWSLHILTYILLPTLCPKALPLF